MGTLINWETKKLTIVVLLVQLSILGLVEMDILGLKIPILRQIIGFIYLTFIPGYLILRILKLHRLGNIETLLYTVGLSITFVMFTGFSMSIIYPIIGISRPISIQPILATFSIIVFFLCIIVFKREANRKMISQSHDLYWPELLSAPALFLFMLPILSALGAFLVYLNVGKTILLTLLFFIALISALIACEKWIPVELYPLALIMISIALLWHYSLVSPTVFGFDATHEYYIQKRVLDNSVWDYTYPSNVNAMLSVTMLAPIYSIFLNLDSAWIFKIAYRLFFSMVPLALFQAYRKQSNDKTAFLATFFFMSWSSFFIDAGGYARQSIAEIFFALSILLFSERDMRAIKRTVLMVIFGLSIVVSHYALSYIFMIYLLLTLPLLFLWRTVNLRKKWKGLVARSIRSKHSDSHLKLMSLDTNYVALFIVFCLTWYMYFSSGSSFIHVVKIGNHMWQSISSEFFSLEARDPHILQILGLSLMRGNELAWKIAKIFQYITLFFIIIGIAGLIRNLRKTRFRPEFIAMTLLSLVILMLSIILPFVASAFNMTRIYHVTLFFLAPFFIRGGTTVFNRLSKNWRQIQSNYISLTLTVMLVLIPYFLFTTGFIFELTGATPTSMPLSLHKADWCIFTKSETQAIEWLINVKTNHSRVYGDAYGYRLPYQYLGPPMVIRLPFDASRVRQDSYIFLRYWNIIHGEILLYRKIGVQSIQEYINLRNDIGFSEVLHNRSEIYDNGWAQILGPE